jgi:sn-glycerol 3-phosphate transport system substrate-binding protein
VDRGVRGTIIVIGAAVLTAIGLGCSSPADDGAAAGTDVITEASPPGTRDDPGPTGPIDGSDPAATLNGSDPTAAPEGPDSTAAGVDGHDRSVCAPPDPGEPREVRLWYSVTNRPQAELLALIDRYNDLGTGITVVAEQRGGYSEVLSDLAALADDDGSERPDLVLVDQRGVQLLADSGRFVPPTACTPAETFDDLVPVIRAAYQLDGRIVAFPFAVSTPVLMSNAAYVEAAGLDPADPPATLAELGAASQQIVASGAADFGFAAHDGWGPWFVNVFDAQAGRDVVDPGNGRGAALATSANLTSDSAIASFAWLRDQVAAGNGLWVGENASGANDLIRLIAPDDTAAFTLSTSAALGDVVALLAEGSFPEARLVVAPMPSWDGSGSGNLVGGAGFWLTADDDPEQVGAAHEVLEWLSAPPQHAAFVAGTGYVPLRASEVDEPGLAAKWSAWPQMRVAYDVLRATGDDAVWAGPAMGPADEVHNLVLQALTRVMVDEVDPGVALADAELRSNDLLAAYEVVRAAE